MFSTLTKIITTKIDDNISVSIFDLKDQNIIIKGKLGQTLLLWKSSENEDLYKTKWNINNKASHVHFFLKENKILDLPCVLNNKPNFSKWPKPKFGRVNNSSLILSCVNQGLNIKLKEKNRGLSFINDLKLYTKGILQGYTMNLKLRGIGFNASYLNFDSIHIENQKDNTKRFKILQESIKKIDKKTHIKQALSLYLGKCHNLIYEIPIKFVKISQSLLKKSGIISITGINLNYTSQVALSIQNYKKPDPYKGKGISFEDSIFISKKEQKK